MNFIGVDLHKKSITVCVMDEKRKVLARKTFACTQTDEIVEFFRQFRPFEVVVEATASYVWFVELVEPLAEKVVLANPKKLRVIAESTKKTDRLDAQVLTEFLVRDMIPESYQPTPRQRQHRALVRHRQYLQGRITSVRSKIRHILSNYNADRKDLFSANCGPAYLKEVRLSDVDRFVIKQLWAEWQDHLAQRLAVSKKLKAFVAKAPRREAEAREILKTAPGGNSGVRASFRGNSGVRASFGGIPVSGIPVSEHLFARRTTTREFRCQRGIPVSEHLLGEFRCQRGEFRCQSIFSGGIPVSGGNSGVRGEFRCQGGIPVSGGNSGVRGEFRCQGGIPVSGGNSGVRGEFRCQGGIPVSGGNSGVRGEFRCQGGIPVSEHLFARRTTTTARLTDDAEAMGNDLDPVLCTVGPATAHRRPHAIQLLGRLFPTDLPSPAGPTFRLSATELLPFRERVQDGIGMPGAMAAVARPGILARVGHHRGPHWLGLDVPQNDEHVVAVLDDRGSEAALPDVVAGSLSPVVPPGVSDGQGLEDAADRLPGGRLEKQMKMVGHQAVAEERERVPCLGAGEIAKKHIPFAVGAEDIGSVVPAVDRVVNIPLAVRNETFP